MSIRIHAEVDSFTLPCHSADHGVFYCGSGAAPFCMDCVSIFLVQPRSAVFPKVQLLTQIMKVAPHFDAFHGLLPCAVRFAVALLQCGTLHSCPDETFHSLLGDVLAALLGSLQETFPYHALCDCLLGTVNAEPGVVGLGAALQVLSPSVNNLVPLATAIVSHRLVATLIDILRHHSLKERLMEESTVVVYLFVLLKAITTAQESVLTAHVNNFTDLGTTLCALITAGGGNADVQSNCVVLLYHAVGFDMT